MSKEMREQIAKFNRFKTTINENNNKDLDRITKLKDIHDDLIDNYVSLPNVSKELMKHSTDGYEMGEYNYPVVYFVGEYCLVVGSGVYRKV